MLNSLQCIEYEVFISLQCIEYEVCISLQCIEYEVLISLQCIEYEVFISLPCNKIIIFPPKMQFEESVAATKCICIRYSAFNGVYTYINIKCSLLVFGLAIGK